MSVLTHLIQERENWVYRNRAGVFRSQNFRSVTDFLVFVAAGLLLYLYHDQVIMFIRLLPGFGG